MEEYIGSQQHFEDCVNEHYDREEEMNRQMEKQINKQIYQQIQEQPMKTGFELICDERREQIEKHGWTLEHDKDHTNGELVQAALFCIEQSKWPKIEIAVWPEFWERDFEWKIRNKSEIGKLVVAGAFYLAETDRTGTIYDMEVKMLAAEIDRLLASSNSD